MKKIAVLGYGVVGSGVVDVFYKNKDLIEKRIGEQADIKYILKVRDVADNDPYKDKITKNFDDIINDDEVSIVAEVMGGITFAYDCVKKCLEKGKSVITSNKELVAKKGAELLKIAKEKNVNFLFEASVGGGIPIIRPLHQCLYADEIVEINGILNGTTNFILTKMINENMPFEEALEMAQELGYAEKDPTDDVEGFDAIRKICILASLAFGKHIYPKFAQLEGITKLTVEDAKYARKLNSVIKLIGKCKKNGDGKVFVTVAPFVVSNSCPLSAVKDVFNAVMVKGNCVDEVMFYGKGAGKFPTASAVVGDIVDAIKTDCTIKTLWWEDCTENIVSNYKEEPFKMMIRIKASQNEKALVIKHFKYVSFVEPINDKDDELCFVTEKISTYEAEKTLKELGKNIVSIIKIMD